jgi:hypothetical protein
MIASHAGKSCRLVRQLETAVGGCSGMRGDGLADCHARRAGSGVLPAQCRTAVSADGGHALAGRQQVTTDWLKAKGCPGCRMQMNWILPGAC